MSAKSKALALCAPVLMSLAFAAAPAGAAEPRPGWELFGRSIPTNLAPDGEGFLTIYLLNVGAAGSTGTTTLTDTLPAGLEAESAYYPPGGGIGEQETPGCTGAKVVTCNIGPVASENGFPPEIVIPVKVAANATSEPTPVNHVAVSGGGALSGAQTSFPIRYSTEIGEAGFAGFDTWLTNADGSTDTQAGSHPYEFSVIEAPNVGSSGNVVGGEQRHLSLQLPPGLVGDPQAVPRCPRTAFQSTFGENCPQDTIVGEDNVIVNNSTTVGFFIYNLVPPPGLAAEFGFNFNGNPVYFDSGVRTGTDNGIITHIPSVPTNDVTMNTATLWGVPGEHLANGGAAGTKPLLSMPTSCGAPPEFSLGLFGTWQNESARATARSVMHDEEDNPVGMTGCERLVHFEPTTAIQPETTFSDTPAGLSVDVKMPQEVNPEGLATAGLKDTTVTLPAGVVINPGQGTGLLACPEADDGLGEVEGQSNEGPPSCPNASKVGVTEITTPTLANKLVGNVYVLESEPPAIKLLITASGEGVNLKLPATVHLDEANGQLTTTVENTPDLPFNEFKLTFSGGPQAALATPTVCGTYDSNATFSPWSDLENALVESNFQITSGPGGSGPCSAPLPFTPTLTAGATTDQAGGYTDFSMLLTRGDGQQRIDGLQFKAPAGLTGFLSHVPLCTNAQAEANACPAASKIGHTVVESGPGPYPLVIPEAGQEPAPIYLTEAYGGAPFGLSIVVPIHAGPFTLPTQRVRASIAIDLHTAQLTITTNPLPQEVAGIPTDLREVDAVIERPEFMVNPTSCNPQEFSGTAYGTPPPGQGGPGASAPISSHFQVGACQALKFEPKFAVSASGENSKAEGASLTAKVSYPNVPQGTDADIAKVKVELPKQLPSRLTTLQKACVAKVFEANPASCPPESFIGHVVVHTPLLPVPLIGPAIFVSHGSEAFPSLTLVLQGDGVTIDIVGTTFISKAGITSNTFKTVPDAPFSSFELSLPQGKFSALAADGNLCAVTKTVTTSKKETKKVKGKTKKVTVKVKKTEATSLVMPTELIGQNGAEIHESTPISVSGCKKAKVAKKKKVKKGKNKAHPKK